MPKLDARSLVLRSNKLFSSQERGNVDETWCLLSEFIIPNQSGLFQNVDSPGSKKTNRLYDSSAIQANHDLAAAMHATLTNPATKWSKLRFKDEELNNNDESLQWLEQANNTIHDFINESNFDTQISKNYQIYSSLGTMVLLHDVDREGVEFSGYKFNAWHLSEVAFSENSNGIVDVLYRRFKLTARQAIEKFEGKVSDKIKEAAEEDPEQEFKFLHCIFPRPDELIKLNEDGKAPGKSRPYASVFIDLSENLIVQEGGYYEFPAYVVRWQTLPGEVYGRGPGHIALPDIRTLNKLKDLNLRAVSKAVNPPMLASSRNILGNLDLRPGQITVLRDLNPNTGFREMQTAARFDVTQLSSQDLKESIRSIFFIDKLFLPPRTETGEMTSNEVNQRLAQMQRVLGPTLSRLNSELLTPLVTRAFKILLREDALPAMPPILQAKGIEIDIVFVNQLSRSQQIDDLTNMVSFVQEVAGLAQVKPEALDLLDVDGIVKQTAKIRGIPEIALTNDDEVEEIRNAREQQQQAATALDAGNKMADIQSKTQGGNNNE